MMAKTPCALIVDDEPDIRELISLTLTKMDITCVEAENVTQAKKMLTQKNPSLCLTDMRLPDGDGIELVEYMQQHHPQIPVAVITAHGNMELAINALKAGAFDFVSKPVNLDILRNLTDQALKLSTQTSDIENGISELLGQSAVIVKLKQMIQRLARSQAPILITGDSGTGKELIARLIHDKGSRNDSPFVPVNCGAIPTELMESEFFGHKKGSFTGAVADHKGLFRAAHQGTIFLDEIADLPLHMQVKLLRVIQEKKVRPVGEDKEFPVDVRILSATHKNLEALIQQGEFRQDLFYRINVIQLHAPKLSDRVEDIELLTNHLLTQLASQYETQKINLTNEAKEALKNYAFPGNVRELENILQRAVTLCEDNEITVDDLQLPQEVVTAQAQEMPLESYLDHMEKDAIVEALERTHWNKTQAAKQLGITLRALRYRIKKLNLE